MSKYFLVSVLVCTSRSCRHLHASYITDTAATAFLAHVLRKKVAVCPSSCRLRPVRATTTEDVGGGLPCFELETGNKSLCILRGVRCYYGLYYDTFTDQKDVPNPLQIKCSSVNRSVIVYACKTFEFGSTPQTRGKKNHPIHAPPRTVILLANQGEGAGHASGPARMTFLIACTRRTDKKRAREVERERRREHRVVHPTGVRHVVPAMRCVAGCTRPGGLLSRSHSSSSFVAYPGPLDEQQYR